MRKLSLLVFMLVAALLSVAACSDTPTTSGAGGTGGSGGAGGAGGAAPDIAVTCGDLCQRLVDCAMPPDPGCDMNCADDLQDCTPSQIADVAACGEGMCADLEACLSAIPCLYK